MPHMFHPGKRKIIHNETINERNKTTDLIKVNYSCNVSIGIVFVSYLKCNPQGSSSISPLPHTHFIIFIIGKDFRFRFLGGISTALSTLNVVSSYTTVTVLPQVEGALSVIFNVRDKANSMP